jgi:hypothetical protein
MRNALVTIACVGVLMTAFAGMASAQTQTPGSVPRVGNLKPFSAETSFMSLPGYLRYLMHQQSAQWLTYDEAARAVRQQTGQ